MADRLLMINRGEQALYGPVDEVRRQYAIHGIVVQGQGDWASLPGIAQVDHRNNRDGTLLYLQPDATPDQVLGTIARSDDYHIERFAMAVPSLNDIFIAVAGERPNGNGEGRAS
jgi:ABC-2 type transport system ATP-binding protein